MRCRAEGINNTITSKQMNRSNIGVDRCVPRQINHGQPRYYLGVPAPPQAPEPYKIAAASSTMTRAHRRSSFVILAESGQISSRSVGGSPAHGHSTRGPMSPNLMIHGRTSPFKPRGFKGPAPHGQARPSSPALLNQHRFIQPKSLSQGNSPKKKSSIPHFRIGFTGNTVKDTKYSDLNRWERRSGRRITTRIPRSSSLRVSIANRAHESTTRDSKLSLVKMPKASPPETLLTTAGGKKLNRSMTKIPVRQSPNGRFIQLTNSQMANEDVNTAASELPMGSSSLSTAPVIHQSSMMNVTAASSVDDSKSIGSTDDVPGLILSLEQSSHGGRTSSVVSATTTTAAQPLRIDAIKILPLNTTGIQNIEEENSVASRGNTPKSEHEDDVTRIKDENPGGGIQSEVIQTVESFVEPKNDGPTTKTTQNDTTADIREVISEKSRKEEVKIQSQVESKTEAVPSKNSGQLEISGNDVGSTDGLVLDSSMEKDAVNQPDIRGENPSVEPQRKLHNRGSDVSLKTCHGVSTSSGGSPRSDDTGVSLNTVRGVSSAREKRGTHIVKRTNDIETLSGNVMNLENRHNGEPTIVEVTEPTTIVNRLASNKQPEMRTGRFTSWRNSFVRRFRDRWVRTYKNRDATIFNWRKKTRNNKQDGIQPGHQMQRSISASSTPTPTPIPTPKPNVSSRLKAVCCSSRPWKSRIVPSETTGCCNAGKCRKIFCEPTRTWCRWSSCCCSRQHEPERNRSTRAKHSLTSIVPLPLSEEQKSKIPDVLIEHNSVMRGAIPCLPVPLAWFCLIWNVFIPGSGTLWSGLFNLCVGQPRFSATASSKSRFGALIVNIIVGTSQFFTVLFCLVGWGWSIWWGITMVRLARKWKRFKAAASTSGDLEGRGPEGVLPAPRVPP